MEKSLTKTFYLNYLKIAPRKVKLVVDLIRHKKVPEAIGILNFTKKRAAKDILKLIHSGKIAFALEHRVPEESLIIKEIQVNDGPRLKRYLPRAYGRASLILKRSSHVKLTLEALPGYRELTDEDLKKLIAKPKKETKSKKETETFQEKESKPTSKKFDIIIPKIFRRKTFES